MVAAARPTECSACVEYCSACFRRVSSFNVPESQLVVVPAPFTKRNTDTQRCCLSRLHGQSGRAGAYAFASHRV